MTIPVYRQNLDYDDWEVASVYDSDDCDSLGRSASYDSSYRSGLLDNPAFQPRGFLQDNPRPHADYLPPQQQQHQNYPLVRVVRSERDTCRQPVKRNNFASPRAPIVPPPGVIFPQKDWVLPPQDMYWPPTNDHMASPSEVPMDVGLMEPPLSSLLLSPSSPPHAPSPQIKRASPTRTIGHGQAPHTASDTMSGTGTRLSVNTRSSLTMSPPARYHEPPVYTAPPRLADAGRQAHLGMTKNPRRPGHDVLSTYEFEGVVSRLPQTHETRAAEERYRAHYGAAGRSDRRLPPSKYEYEMGWPRTAKQPIRERRPSVWQRFVRRFSQSRGVCVGHT